MLFFLLPNSKKSDSYSSRVVASATKNPPDTISNGKNEIEETTAEAQQTQLIMVRALRI
jgi:hypothetical protein